MPSRSYYYEQLLPTDVDPIELVVRLLRACESQTYVVYERDGEWSVALDEAYQLTADAHTVLLSHGEERQHWPAGDLMRSIEAALASITVEDYRAYGTAAFEFAYALHDLDPVPDSPLMQLMVPRVELRVRREAVLLRALSESDLAATSQLVVSICRQHQPDLSQQVSCAMLDSAELARLLHEEASVAMYKALVESATRDISLSELDKVIVSRAVPLHTQVDLLATYALGRRHNTPARSFIIDRPDTKLVGFSPETVLEVSADGIVATQPLAGTRAWVDDEHEDAKRRAELLRDTKELAEHAISVKLAFEELSRVCTAGSVHVDEYMSVSRRGTVQHLASRLSGKLAADNTAWTAFSALFPAVTASGIPKRKAIDWIRRHEAQPRELYSGAVLTVDSQGAMDAALILRSLFQRGECVWMRAGAGIVAQSTPDREFYETCEKLYSVARYLVPVRALASAVS